MMGAGESHECDEDNSSEWDYDSDHAGFAHWIPVTDVAGRGVYRTGLIGRTGIMAAVMAKKHKIKLREVNRHLVCRLCRGYYVDATTIAECLHSFCRSCIIKYLEKNSFCPICEVQIHTAKPHLSLRQDKALQDVVYKLVPGLYHNEMQRRREFYLRNPEQIPVTAPEQCGIEDRIIFSPDEIISLSLERLDREEYVFESISRRSSETGSDSTDGGESILPQQLVLKKIKSGSGKSRKPGEALPRLKRYLRCPAAVEVSHLKKFIRMKYDLGERTKVDIIHKRVSLPDHYTLMDVAYIYTWKRNGPMRLFYYHGDPWTERMKTPEASPEVPEEKCVAEEKEDATAEEAQEVVEKGEKVTETEPSAREVAKPEESEGVGEPAEALTNGHASESEVTTKPMEEKEGGEAIGIANEEAEANQKERAPAEVKSNDWVESVPEPNLKETEPVPSNTSEPNKDILDVKKDNKVKNTITLKNHRKNGGEGQVEAKSSENDVPTVTNGFNRDQVVEKKEADVTIEIRSETKASEYDFESSSPPGKIIPLREFTKSEQSKNKKSENGRMSLQDFRNVMKENGESEVGLETVPKPAKIRLVPSLKRIADNKKSPLQKSNGKQEEPKISPTIINIRTEDGKKENGLEKTDSPPPITIESRGGEYSIRHADENGKPDKETKKRPVPEAQMENTAKRPKTEEAKSDNCGAMDLTKSEVAESGRKNDENMVEALVSAAQKQNIEPLLRVPQFLKNSGASSKTGTGRNISPSEINQALQFFKNLRSDIRVLEAKSRVGPQSEPLPKPCPLQLYQQQMELIKRLKKQQQLAAASDYRTAPKMSPPPPPPPPPPPSLEKAKKSPTAEKGRSPVIEENKSSVERTLSQIQEQFELQARMKNLKNLPSLLQFYSPPPYLYCTSSPPTKPNQSKLKSPSLSPKSPPNNLPLPMTGPGSSFFGSQSYSPMVNAGLSSEMTFHQMFQNYLSQQEKMNQIKPPIPTSRSRQAPQSSSNPVADFYFGGQSETNRSPPRQKT